jgi:CarboxypepD_reg-like domain
MKIILFFSLLLVPAFLFSQKISGYIRSAADKSAVPNATVFINNYSKAVATNKEGYFEIGPLPLATYELVVSSVGFESVTKVVKLDNENAVVNIELPLKVKALTNVIVSVNEAEWRRNFENFKKYFLGQTEFSERCEIVNPKALYLEYDKEARQLKATTDDDVLEIINNALGYKIKYIVKDFLIDYASSYTYYVGYATYEKLEPKNKRQQRKWDNNRQVAYEGSIMHFLRSMHRRTAASEGYVIRTLRRFDNPDRQPDSVIRANMQRIMKSNKGVLVIGKEQDSTRYWMDEGRKPKIIQQLDAQVLQADSVLAMRGNELHVEFPYLLYIEYIKESESEAYSRATQSMFNPRTTIRKSQTSIISLIDPPAIIEAAGSLVNPLALLFEGYWSWEKVGDSLPFEYEEPTGK